MAQFAGTIPLSEIERIQIYDKKRRNTKASMKQILKETGGDIVMTGPIFLKSYKPCCHLKINGKVLYKPDYTAWAISWDSPANFAVRAVPAGFANYMACVKCIIDGRKVDMDYQPDMAYPCNRLAIGVKDGRFAYFATESNLRPEGLQDILFDAGWEDAIMMDGGGTPAILFKDGSGFAGDGRYVPIWIVIHLKKGECPYEEPAGTIKRESKGDGARWVQWQLNRHGAGLIVDGDFGTKSVNALKEFQRSVFTDKKDHDGICGARTKEELRK